MLKNRGLFFLITLLAASAVETTQAITIDTVTIGNAGNVADTRVMDDGTTGYGSVAYNYNIGKYEVTAGQYTAFLNAVAATDTYGLYNGYMADTYGCQIQQTGDSGSYVYSVAADYANRPVNYVSWGDAVRFANWLHNGQPTGAEDLSTTEDGAYYLNGATTNEALMAVSRETDWKWAITSEDEWYKAAYYKGEGLYSLYANGTDVAPVAGTDANYDDVIGHTWDGTTDGDLEQNGTKDMMGNIGEWNEAIIRGSTRGRRGGVWYGPLGLCASRRPFSRSMVPTYESYNTGFRVVSVPEPSSIALLFSVAVAGLIGWRRRK
ncbi:MAG: SUMF1/EgtB/PvdO family nonheme iron enzyme [Thermoguttaceae bacterium]